MATKAILLLIALGIGYLILIFAKREEKVMKVLGYGLGAFIIVISILFILRYLCQYVSACRAITTRPPAVQFDLPKP
jgi:lipid-A-disaccharide synthase-like uncharacterized protein